ncbi:MAG TPA: hypothetical protein VKP13_13125 [Nitrospira sp.]|nr:hypothetical protein [Nitrospira sp.]
MSAESGREAIELMTQADYAATVSVLLCGLTMPDGRGSEVNAHFHRQYPVIPIVVFSGAEPSDICGRHLASRRIGLASETGHPRCHS